MLLADNEITAGMESGRLWVGPVGEDCLQPSSIDVRLSHELRIFPRPHWWHRRKHINPLAGDLPSTRLVTLAEGQVFPLRPRQFVLGSTMEWITVSDEVAAYVEGKSSLGRLGLLPHTAGFIDPGFQGEITLELVNVSPYTIDLTAGMQIAQICFIQLTSQARNPYGSPALRSSYQWQRGPTEARRVPKTIDKLPETAL
jgi:dCTP deaminase